jgi:hypothetical protein
LIFQTPPNAESTFNWNIAVANHKKGKTKKQAPAALKAPPGHIVFPLKARFASDFIFYFGDIAARNKKMKNRSLFSQRLV